MNIEAIGMMVMIILGIAGCLFLIKFDMKRYGLLYLLSALSGNLICYIFTHLKFYSFPYNVCHQGANTPFFLVSTAFPLLVLIGVRYSPKKWIWKIPFYWVIIHLGVLGEVILKSSTIFAFSKRWDLWDSYCLWWIYYLLFELLGGKLIPPNKRRPIDAEAFRYGRWFWIFLHVVLITTIFLAGVYVGWALF